MPILNQVQKIYFIGIHGVAMSGLSLICKQLGKKVAGSDKPLGQIYGNKQKLFEEQSIEVFYGFDPKNLDWGPDLVVQGMSFSDINPEVIEAKKRGIDIITESELRGLLMKDKIGIGVAGVHGKTTTTALLSYIFTKAELDPTYLIGADYIPNLGLHGKYGKGKYVIVEADEYKKSQTSNQPKFLDLLPKMLIITSLELEHPDMFSSVEEMEYQFSLLVNKIPEDGLLVICSDWKSLRKVLENTQRKAVTYGFDKGAQWRAYDIIEEKDQTHFKVEKDGNYFDEFSILLAGRHNVLNALACIIVSLYVGVKIEKLKDALNNFVGVGRRFDIKELDGVTYIDDYGHHPTAIKTTLEAVRTRYPKNRIWCVFQPHHVSRTYHLLEQFARSFAACDKLVLMDIFRAAREKKSDFSSKNLLEETLRHHNDVVYSGDIEKTIEYMRFKIRKGDVVVTMGAGDVYRVRDGLMDEFK